MNDTAMASKTKNRPAAAAPSRKALPPPMQPTGLLALRSASDEAIHWLSKLECLRENNAHAVACKGTLPDWAVAVIGSYEEQHAWYDVHHQLIECARQALQLSERGETSMVFEVWTKRGRRLDGQHDFQSQAELARLRYAEAYPDAQIVRVHRKAAHFTGTVDVAMLDTLVGNVLWAGCSFAEEGEEEIHTVQDETGRCVAAPLSALLSHPVMYQMSKDAQERVGFSAKHAEATKGGE